MQTRLFYNRGIRATIALSTIVITFFLSIQLAFAAAIEIDTCQEFEDINNNLSGEYILTANIDCTSTSFSPIGNFTGTFDGQNYTVSNMTISGINGQAPFDSTTGATIQNVMFVDSSISGNYIVAGVVGTATDGTTIQNVHFSGTLNSIAAQSVAGGIAGQISDSTIRESSADVTITGYSMIGGLVGGNNGTSEIHESYATGTISGSNDGGTSHIGGLVGLGSGDIYNSYATTAVSGNGTYTGGLVGNVNGDGMVKNSYATGAVTNVSADVGGLVGGLTDTATVSNSFWDTDTTLMSTSDGGTGKTTAQMKDVATFTDTTTTGLTAAWDFLGNPGDDMAYKGIWTIASTVNSGYPNLVWGNDEEEPELEQDNAMAPVNNPATGEGDKSKDTKKDLGIPVQAIKDVNSQVTIVYKKGEQKLFSCFATGSGIPKVRFSQNGKNLFACYKKNGKKVQLFNSYTGKKVDSAKLYKNSFKKYRQNILPVGKNRQHVVFVGKKNDKLIVRLFQLNTKEKRMKLILKEKISFPKRMKFKNIRIKRLGEMTHLLHKQKKSLLMYYASSDYANQHYLVYIQK